MSTEIQFIELKINTGTKIGDRNFKSLTDEKTDLQM